MTPDNNLDIEPIWKVKKQLLIEKSLKINKSDIIEIFECLQNTDWHPQKIAESSIFSARQIKKLRYIQKHATDREFKLLLECKYKISSIEKYIKNRIKFIKKGKTEPKKHLEKKYGHKQQSYR